MRCGRPNNSLCHFHKLRLQRKPSGLNLSLKSTERVLGPRNYIKQTQDLKVTFTKTVKFKDSWHSLHKCKDETLEKHSKQAGDVEPSMGHFFLRVHWKITHLQLHNRVRLQHPHSHSIPNNYPSAFWQHFLSHQLQRKSMNNCKMLDGLWKNWV